MCSFYTVWFCPVRANGGSKYDAEVFAGRLALIRIGHALRANRAARSGSDPKYQRLASRADVASMSSRNRSPVRVATSATGRRCEGQRECRSDTLDRGRAAVHPSVDGRRTSSGGDGLVPVATSGQVVYSYGSSGSSVP